MTSLQIKLRKISSTEFTKAKVKSTRARPQTVVKGVRSTISQSPRTVPTRATAVESNAITPCQRLVAKACYSVLILTTSSVKLR